MTDKIPCTECGAMILPATADKTGGLCMPCKQGIRADIEASKEFYKEQRELEKQYDPFRELWLSLVDRAYKDEKGFDNLSEDEKIYFYLGILDGEAFNGGLHQFFTNTSGDRYEETLQYLELMDAMHTHALLKKAKTILFGDAPVPVDHQERNETIAQFPEDDDTPEPEWCIALDEVDDEYYKDLDKLSEKMNQFAIESGILKPFLKDEQKD